MDQLGTAPTTTGRTLRQQELRELLEGVEGFDRTFGRVFASSGLRPCLEGYIQD